MVQFGIQSWLTQAHKSPLGDKCSLSYRWMVYLLDWAAT